MENQFKAYLAGQLRSYRRDAGLTQEELGTRINRTAEAISNIERSKSLPGVETLLALSETLRVPLRDFFPSGSFDEHVSLNRLKLEAEAMALLRGLTDSQLKVGLTQIRALGEL